jgi:hypothetical protein
MPDAVEVLDQKISKLMAARDAALKTRHQYPWRVGQKVKYVKTQDWGPSKGSTGRIVQMQDTAYGEGNSANRPMPKNPNDYCVFWVGGSSGAAYWTTPDDVIQMEP